MERWRADYIATLVDEMEKAWSKGKLWIYIRNIQTGASTLLKDDTIFLSPSYNQIENKLRSGLRPEREELIELAEETYKVFEPLKKFL